MSDILPAAAGGRLLNVGDSKRVGRAISRGHAITTIRCNNIEDETDVELGKVDATTTVTTYGMGAVVRVAQVQQHAETMAPAASGRLAMLADNHALIVGDMQVAHARRLRCK